MRLRIVLAAAAILTTVSACEKVRTPSPKKPSLTVASAEEAAAPDCSVGPIAADTDSLAHLELAKITPGPRAHFYSNREGCPADGDACLSKAYLVTGDVVLIGERRGPYFCAVYPNRDGYTNGWLMVDRLDFSPIKTSSEWTGEWTNGGSAWLTITKTDSALGVRGAAQWPPIGVESDISPRTGDLDGTLKLDATGAEYVDVEPEPVCHARFRRVGPYLAVVDDNNCGGMNASFTGLYRRKR